MTSYAHIRESEVQAALPIGAHIGEFVVIALGRFTRGAEGSYPIMTAILAREEAPFFGEQYSVHDVVAVCSAGGMSAPALTHFSLMNGDYDLTLDQAKHYLDER